MTRTDALEARLALVRAATDGVLDQLRCPTCSRRTVTVRFTNPRPSEFRTWFLCTSCAFRMRTQNDGKPLHFSIERLDPELDAMDRG